MSEAAPDSATPAASHSAEDAAYYRASGGLPADPLPFVATQANMEAPMRKGTVKNLWSSLGGKSSHVGQAFFADVFDPAFATYIERAAEQDAQRLKQNGAVRRRVLFAFIEQTDWMRGVEGRHPHLGWGAAAADFQMREGVVDFGGHTIQYDDPKLYTKYAMRDLLKAKYGDIAALNRAWGTSYITWDSQGGWGKGSGWLDEDGSRLGSPTDPGSKQFPAMRQDLDQFGEKIMRQFYKTVYTIRKQKCPELLLSTNNMGTPKEYVVKGMVSEDGNETYADVICIKDRDLAAKWYPALKRPFFVVSVSAQAVNDSPLGYMGIVSKVVYEDVLKDSRKVLTDNPKQNPNDRKVVDDLKSRAIITAASVNFWWAQNPKLKIPFRTYTQFSSLLECRTYAGKQEDVRFASRPWKSVDWLAADKFAVEGPAGTYFCLKDTLRPGDTFWRTFPRNNSATQEDRAASYRREVLDLVNARAENGDYIYCGVNWWAWWDTSWTGITWDEAFNVGLVTFHDNAYDGREAVWARGKDEDGYPIGGEYRPPHMKPESRGFGDFLSGVTRTNAEVQQIVAKRGHVSDGK